MEAIRKLLDPAITGATIIGFLLLLAVLAKYLFKPILGLLDQRKLDIQNTYDNANDEKSKAEELRAGYERKLSEIEAEARSRIQEAVKEAQDAKDQILAEARTRSEDILKRGQEDLEREREKTLAQLREEVVGISVAAASKLIGESLDDPKHRKLVNDFIDKIGTA